MTYLWPFLVVAVVLRHQITSGVRAHRSQRGEPGFRTRTSVVGRRRREGFPSVKFVLGHGGVTHVEVSAYLAAYRANVYVDIGGFAGGTLPGGWKAHLNKLFRMGINHKISSERTGRSTGRVG